MNTSDVLKAVMTEEKFAKSERYKININIYTLRMSDMVVRLGCSLRYKSTWYLNQFILNDVDRYHSAF